MEPWSIGVLEYWSIGVLEHWDIKKDIQPLTIAPILQYFGTPEELQQLSTVQLPF